MRRSFSVDEKVTARLADAIESDLMAQSAGALLPLLEHDACKVLDWSTVRAEELVQRELDRRKPTLVAGSGQSIGMRDTAVSYTHLTLPTNREV